MFLPSKFLWAGVLLLLVGFPSSSTAQAPSYTIKGLGSPAGSSSCQLTGLNASGVAVGAVFLPGTDPFSEAEHAAIFGQSSLTDLGTFGGASSEAFAINTAGTVVGAAAVFGDRNHAFAYASGAMTDLGVLGGDTDSEATGINTQGQVVGISYSDQGASHGVLYDHGTVTQIGPFAQGTYCGLAGINDNGQIVGTADNNGNLGDAFIYTKGVMQDLGKLPGGTYSTAMAINARGQVVGSADDANANEHAFLYTNGAMRDLGTLSGGTYSQAVAINAAVQAVGVSNSAINPDVVPVLFSGGHVYDLSSLVPADSGWSLQHVSGINDSGQIVGDGLDPQGNPRAFLLMPQYHARFDFDGDGRNDILWRNTSTGQTLTWNMNDQKVMGYGSPFAVVSNPGWTISAAGDVNGDGHPDLLWQNRATGQVLFWLMGGTTGTDVLSYGSPFVKVGDTHWHIVSMTDFNGDGHPDLLWENSATGQLVIWYLDGTNVVRYGTPFATVADTRWQVAGTADFDGDGHPDLLWENSQTGQILVWNLGGTDGTQVQTYGSPFTTVADTHWHVVGTADADGDGHPDLMWQNTQTGQVVRWLLGGTGGTDVQQYGGAMATVSDTHWQIIAVH